MNDMKAIIQADELAKDVAGAEALLERHQEHKVNYQLMVVVIHSNPYYLCLTTSVFWLNVIYLIVI